MPHSSFGQAVLEVSVEVDLGRDIGQRFGSLFEVRDKQGRVMAGAGFADVYNTRFRVGRDTLQFFLRLKTDEGRFTFERLPRPTDECGVSLFDLDGKVYAWSSGRERVIGSWGESARRWEGEHSDKVRSGDGKMRVGEGILEFDERGARFNDRLILSPAAEGVYHHFYYANGHLVFFHDQSSHEPKFGKLYACPWTPDSGQPVNLAQAAVTPLTYPRETPFAFGQLGRTVLTCSNNGGVYAFDGRAWRTLRPANNQVSYQVYSVVNYYERLLMAHYPSGILYEFDGQDIKPLEGWPPVLEGVAKSAREAQTTMVYRGDLFVGVWPWAELWRRDRVEDQWVSMGRLFTQPRLTDKVQHPYEQEVKDFNAAHGANIVINQWGQRVASMIPSGDALILSTSAKWPCPREPRLTCLTDAVYEEYGQVIRLRMPGNLAATLQPKAGATRLAFVVAPDGMAIHQDGKLLATTRLDAKVTADIQPASIRWGHGVFGPLQGKFVSKSVRPTCAADAP